MAQDGFRLVVVKANRDRRRPRGRGRGGLGGDQAAPGRADPPAVRAGRVHLPDQLGLGRHRRRGQHSRYPAGSAARGDHRPAGRPEAAGDRRPGHRDAQHQAPDGRRAKGSTGYRMVTRLPRLVIAAPASGHGKTTVATGLMAALGNAGHRVSAHKIGPDYIDPGYHALATGRPGRNLDPHLVGTDLLVPLLLHGASMPVQADIAIIEGVMGLYDGAIGREGFASTAHVAGILRAPVILVVDISASSRTVAAVVHGLATFDNTVRIAGVILNKAGSERHATEARQALQATGMPVLGVLHRDDGISAPSRHLGLVPAAERGDARQALDRLAAQIADRVDLAGVVRIAGTAADLVPEPWDPHRALATWLPDGATNARR